MKTCLALRHVDFEDLGLFARPLAEHGYAVRYLDTPVASLDPAAVADADLLVVLGGPMAAYETDRYPWLAAEFDAVAARLAARRPTLGVCLGAQLMAKALGAAVVRAPAVELGWAPLSLTEAGRASPLAPLDGLAVLHWHGDRFDLPPGATRLAATALCPHQAFSHGDHALALQFHAEVDPDRIEPWITGNATDLADADVAADALRAATARHGPAIAAAAPALLAAWLRQLA